ncbi:MAG: 3-phosphoglycerate dehydrogenase [Clostridia bacterium]|nr:3-phosphoglycerate dehydrogenase [Clostridia bacterium]
MYNVKLLNKISQTGLAELGPDFKIVETTENADAIILRSADMHEYTFEDSLLGIARAGAGVNNIPIQRCTEAGIAVFNTPGANANAVKELAICALLLASRRIPEAIQWTSTLDPNSDVPALVEKGKKDFGGCELAGKKLGVIGLGAVGGMVANAAHALGMEVYGIDPFLSVDAAWHLSRHIKHAPNNEYIFQNCDYLSIHVPLNDSTRGMLNAEVFAAMKPGMRIINLSRGGLANNDDLKAAIAAGQVARYVTDFPEADLLNVDNIVTIPHLGASTEESEENCAVMAARQIAEYMTDGTIHNSVNLPDFAAERGENFRIAIINKNIPNIIVQITSALASEGINIEHMFNRAKKDYAYTVIDTDTAPTEHCIKTLEKIMGVIRVRVIK